MHDPARHAEARDALTALRARGYGPLLDALADPDVCKGRSGRLVMAPIARRLDMTTTQVAELLKSAQATILS